MSSMEYRQSFGRLKCLKNVYTPVYLGYRRKPVQNGIINIGKVKIIDNKKLGLLYRLIGIRIMYYRTLRGWNQDDLAKHAGVSKSTISKIEQGKYGLNLSVAMILKMAETLNVRMEVLLVPNNQDSKVIDDMRRGIPTFS